MRPTLYLCHAAADQHLALALAAFLEAGTTLTLELRMMKPQMNADKRR